MRFRLFFIGCLMFLSCSKDEAIRTSQAQYVRIKANEVYAFNTEVSGDEDGMLISEQARFFKRSELVRSAHTNWEVRYIYQPQADFTGLDKVVLTTMEHVNGSGQPGTQRKIELAIYVTP